MSEIALDTLKRLLAAEKRSASTDPKYIRVCEAFAEGIRRGDFKPGQRIPAETELCALLPVSLGTVQKALGRLAATGLVVRNRKTGTFVADRRSQASETWVYRFRNPVTGNYPMPFVKVIDVVEDRSRGPWREVLQADRCVRLDRLLWIESDPPAFTSVYFAYKHGKVLLNVPIEELHGSSTHRVMVEHFNLPTLRIEHRIGCRELSPDACVHLKLSPATVGTVWDVSDYSFEDKPILFQRLQLPPGHRPLEIPELMPGSKAPTGPDATRLFRARRT